jgi:hypothetical protein
MKLNAQTTTDIELHNRYWTYRENFRKYFSSIGKENGQGLPFSDIRLGTGADVVPLDNSGAVIPNASGGFKGMLNVGGDVTYYFAEYLGVLSSEYWLLKNQGKSESEEMKAVKSEIYFAINAIERLDKGSKPYFEPNSSIGAIDGFFIRDDENPSIIKYFELYNYPQVEFMSGIASHGREIDPDFKDRKKDGVYISSQLNSTSIKEYYWWNKSEPNAKQTDLYAFYRDPETKADRGNEMSMDQLIGVLFGLKCVIKFVDSDVEVEPDYVDGGGVIKHYPKKNIHAWVKELVDKMMLHLTETTYDVYARSDEEIDKIKDEVCKKMNAQPWINVKTKIRYRTRGGCISQSSSGKNCILDECTDFHKDVKFKPTNSIIIAHSNYVHTNPHIGRNVYRGNLAFGFGYPFEKLGESITGLNYESVKVTLNAKAQLLRLFDYLLYPTALSWMVKGKKATLLDIDKASLMRLGRKFEPHNNEWWRDAYNYMPRREFVRDEIRKSTAAGMLIWLPAASETWTHQEYFKLMENFNRKDADLIWSALNDETPIIKASEIESLLLSSKCEAIQNAVDQWTNAPFNITNHFSKISSNGLGEGYEPNNSDRGNTILYNGLDWMLLYNFYRMADLKNLNEIKNAKLNSQKFVPIPFMWKVNESNINKSNQRLPLFENNYCPCKSSYEFYQDRMKIPSSPRGYFNDVEVEKYPFTPSNPDYRGLGNLKMFNKDYERYGIHLSDYLTNSHPFEILNGGVLIPKGNLTICNTTLIIKWGGKLATSANPNSPFETTNPGQTIRIGKNGILKMENNSTLIIEDNTQLIIEEGGKLMFTNGAKIKLRGPESKLIIRGTVELQANSPFTINLDLDALKNGKHGQVIIDRWYKPNSNTPPPFTSTDGKGRLNFTGLHQNDFLLTIIGNAGLAISSDHIEQATFKNCRVSFDQRDAMLLLEPKNSIWIENCSFNNLKDNYLMYQGIQISGSTNYVFNSLIKFAKIGIDFNYLKRNGNPDRLNLENVNFESCMQAIRTNGSMSYIKGRVSKYGELAIQNIGDNNGTVIQDVDFRRENSVNINGVNAPETATKAILFQGTTILLRKNRFGSPSSFDMDYYKASLYNNKSILICNSFDNTLKTHLTQTRGLLSLRGNWFDHFDFINGSENTSGIAAVRLQNSELALWQGYNAFLADAKKPILLGELNKNKQRYTPLTGPYYFYEIDARDNFFYGKPKPFSPSSYNIYFWPSTGKEDVFLNLTSNYNSASSTHISGADFMNLRQSFCDDKLDLKGVPVMKKVVHKRSSGDNPLPEENFLTDTTLMHFNSALVINKTDKYDTKRPRSTSTVNVLTANMGVANLSTFYDSLTINLYNNPSTSYASWISNITTVLSNDTLPSDTLTNAYKDEIMEDLTYAIGRGIESWEFLVSSNDTFDLDTSILKVARFYDTAWIWANTGHPYWSNRKPEIIENWARTYRQGEKRAEAIEVLSLGLDSITDASSQALFTTWKCISNAELVYLNDSISTDSFYKLLTCMPAIDAIPLDSIEIKHDTLSYCHWDSAVLAKPDGAKYIAGNRPHYILNLSDSTILPNLHDNLYHIKEGNYKLIYTPTLLSEYEVKQLAIYKTTYQTDTIDSIYNICSLLTSDTAVYKISWDLPFKIEKLGDTSHLYIDSNFMYHLPHGSYVINVFDSANCSLKVTNLSVVINAADTITRDSTMKAVDWSAHGIATSVTVPYYPSIAGQSYSVLNLADTSYLPDTSAVLNLHAGNYRVKSIDSGSCQVIFTNLKVEVDTPNTESQDSTVYFCQFDDSSFYSLDTMFKDLPMSIQMVSPIADSISTNQLMAGTYVVKYSDTTNGMIYLTNLTVTATSIDLDTTYKSITYCDWEAYGFDTIRYIRYRDSLPYSIDIISSSLDSFRNDSLTSGSYIVTSYDFNNCRKILTYLTVSSDTSQIVEMDSTVSYCDFDSSGFVVQNAYNYYTNHITQLVTIIRTTPTYDTLSTNQLTEGEYTVTVYATEECTRYVTHYTVTKSTPETIYLDSTISYCNAMGTNYIEYYPADSLPYTIIKTAPVADSGVTIYLNAGTYKIRHIDTNNCRIYETTLTVIDSSEISTDSTISYCDWEGGSGCASFVPPLGNKYEIVMLSPESDTMSTNCLSEGSYKVTSYDSSNCRRYVFNLTVDILTMDTVTTIDTLTYSCDNDSAIAFMSPCGGPVIDKFSNPLTPVDGTYTLNPHYGYYIYYCDDTINCKVNRVIITFSDLIEVPYMTEDYADGTFDRSTGDSCCFVRIDHLECSGRELVENDEIEIFTIAPSAISTFVLKTTINYYGESHILGFKFCPPQWDVSEEHINDWYSIVMKKDTCDFCRFDFMCDSTNVFEYSVLTGGFNSQNRNNKTLKKEPSIAKVKNTEGGISRIVIYPNPTSNEVNVKVTNTTEDELMLNIFDNAGKLVYSNIYNGLKDYNLKLSLNDLTSGIYTINIPSLNYNYKLVLIK